MSEGWPAEAYQHYVDKYLPLYEKYRLVDPFTKEEECQRQVSNLLIFGSTVFPTLFDVDMEKPELQDQPNIEENAIFIQKQSVISNTLHLIMLMRKLHTFFVTRAFDAEEQVFNGQQILMALKWKEDLFRDCAQVASLRFNGAFSTVFLSFWQAIDFDPTMRTLSIAQLSQHGLKSLAKQLWRLAPNSVLLTQFITKELGDLCSSVTHWCSHDLPCEGWKQIVEIAIQIMINALPPLETLDPVVYNEQRISYQTMVFNAVNDPLSVLARWRSRISGQASDCDSRSFHPVIAAMWRTRSELEKSMVEGEDGPKVYRQKASELKLSEQGLESLELLSWASRDASPMPLRLKAAVVRHRVSLCIDPLYDLEWIRRQWQKWYEKNVAKAAEKDFVYRTKTEEEKDVLESPQEHEILPEGDLISLIEATVSTTPEKGNVRDTNYSIALVWLRHVLCGLHSFDQDLHAATVGGSFSVTVSIHEWENFS
ncbi:unnamed protein product [Strongylus vulgaris]|uniref:Uncharacterized protein n=1 Tax=Strongylus vulgaris TaxID=40348 RepID=A0A3P7ISD6_STRVU|nr:unnamed protein product [Strongylus vulgaris]